MHTPYWSQLLDNRVSRRRALAATGATAAGAAFLAGCGGGSDKKTTAEAPAKLLLPVVDESKTAKRGGVYKNIATRDPGGVFEPHNAGTGALSVVAYTY